MHWQLSFLVFLSKDYKMDSYILGFPVPNEEARKKLEHMDMEVPEQRECEKEAECSPNIVAIGDIEIPEKVFAFIATLATSPFKLDEAQKKNWDMALISSQQNMELH